MYLQSHCLEEQGWNKGKILKAEMLGKAKAENMAITGNGINKWADFRLRYM